MQEIVKRLREGAALLDIDLTDRSVERLVIYFHELRKWSRKINLVARSITDEELIEKHFLDSLTLLRFLPENAHLLDVGTGAGFPGLVCRAARDDLSVSLVEPREKRISFLKHVVRTLSLAGVDVHCCRIEDEAQVVSGSGFTHITCRAVTDIRQFILMAERFSGNNPQLMVMKGPKWHEELVGAEDTVRQSSYTFVETHEWKLPFSGAHRALLIFCTN